MQKIFTLFQKHTFLFFLVSLFIIPVELSGQQMAFPMTTSEAPVHHREKIKDWTEIVSERTPHSSTYKKPDGAIVIYTSRELVNYTDASGKLIPVNTIPEFGSFGQEKGWLARHQEHPFFVSEKGEAKILSGEKSFKFAATRSFNNSIVKDLPEARTMGDTVILENIVPGVDKIFMFRNNGMKYNYMIHSSSAIPNTDLIIEEEIEIPEGYAVHFPSEAGEKDKLGWKGFIHFRNESASEVIRISPLWCFDQNKNGTTGSYKIINGERNKIVLQMIVPSSWLNDPSLQFPLVIDPLVTGPTSLWSGGMMPSCFTPNYNVDSMLITIPAQITATALNVTSNYYANPFSTSVMADGNMYFSTNCGNSTNFTVQPPTGSTAGTAYLEDFNLRSPLLCCIPQSCSQQTFYLRMHLSRTTNGTTCNTSYIYYDPTSVWPFSAYIEGYTVEAFSSQLLLLDNNICSDVCDIEERSYIRYGVPPYTIDHPWMAGPTLTVGTPAGCNNGNQITSLSLLNPNCTNYCDTSTSIQVPSPIVTDACGNVISGWLDVFLSVKPVPQVVPPDTLNFCSGDPVIIPMTSCVPGATIVWQGPAVGGTGDIADSTILNNSGNNIYPVYAASANLNGCFGDTVTFTALVEPTPNVSFILDPPTVFATQPVSLLDNSQTPGVIVSWWWTKDDSLFSIDQNTTMVFDEPGDYEVCFAVQTENGCTDTSCQTISVIPLELVLPNVISPNADGTNDFLVFPYLEFYEKNTIQIFNRWGIMIYEKENYMNEWNGEDHPDGIYFYTLTTGEQKYNGFVHVVR